METKSGQRVFTPLGQGSVLHRSPSGVIVVLLDSGGQHSFFPEDIFSPYRKASKRLPTSHSGGLRHGSCTVCG